MLSRRQTREGGPVPAVSLFQALRARPPSRPGQPETPSFPLVAHPYAGLTLLALAGTRIRKYGHCDRTGTACPFRRGGDRGGWEGEGSHTHRHLLCSRDRCSLHTTQTALQRTNVKLEARAGRGERELPAPTAPGLALASRTLSQEPTGGNTEPETAPVCRHRLETVLG